MCPIYLSQKGMWAFPVSGKEIWDFYLILEDCAWRKTVPHNFDNLEQCEQLSMVVFRARVNILQNHKDFSPLKI